jgi:hypothetical protein
VKKSKPRGVESYREWLDGMGHDDTGPFLEELLVRYTRVFAAVCRYRAAGEPVPSLWLVELGVAQAVAVCVRRGSG